MTTRRTRWFGQYLRSLLMWTWFVSTVMLGSAVGVVMVWFILHYHLGVIGLAVIKG